MIYTFNRKSITVRIDSVLDVSPFRGFEYDKVATEKRAIAISLLLGAYNPLKGSTSISIEKLHELQQQLEDIIWEVKETVTIK